MSIIQKLKGMTKAGILNPPDWLFPNMQYLTIVGSQAYGMNTTDSDLDIYGVCIEPKRMIYPNQYGLIHGFDNCESFNSYQEHNKIEPDSGKNYDITVYGIVKFFKELTDGTPNIVETLFTDQNVVLFSTPLFNRIRAKRHLFLTKRFSFKCRMYAMAQLKRTDRNLEPDSKRQKLIEQFGFDVKASAHVRRLLGLSEDILLGEVPDLKKHSEAMKAIRTGVFSKQEVKEYATQQEKKLNLLEAQSGIRQTVDFPEVKELLTEIINIYYGSIQAIQPPNKDLINDLKNLIEKYED